MTKPPGARDSLVGLMLILTSAAGYGLQAIFARLAYAAGANVFTVLLLRFVMALAVLWPVLLLGGRGKHAWAAMKQPKRLLSLLALGVLFSGNSIAFFTKGGVDAPLTSVMGMQRQPFEY